MVKGGCGKNGREWRCEEMEEGKNGEERVVSGRGSRERLVEEV